VIAFYDAKYTYRFWRPVTAIRAADSAANSQTVAAPNWLPLPVNTPSLALPGRLCSTPSSAAISSASPV